MNNREILKRIYVLREKAERNKLAVFVGAGVSCNVKDMPSWGDLVAAMAREIGYSKCTVCRHKKTCEKRCKECKQRKDCQGKCLAAKDLSTDDYLKIPQYVFNHNRQSYKRVIKENIDDKCIPDAPLSKAIFEIHPAHIITTNYDRLLEASDSEFCRQYDVVISDADLLDSEKSKYIIKMHGDVTKPNTIVLKEQDYLEYSQKHVLIELFIKALLADHTILFLGYSLNDYNVKLIISWLNFLRSQNKSITKGRYIGHIVLDEERLDKNTVAYFRSNNIEVINIHRFPLIKDIPAQLTDDRGKRLYSFLSIINDPFLEDGVSSQMSMERAISFLDRHTVFDYTVLLKYLHVSNYRKFGSSLIIFDEATYERLSGLLATHSETAVKLEQMLKNVGISTIEHQTDKKYYTTNIDTNRNNNLLSDDFFSLYIQNRYNDLLSKCALHSGDILKHSFYRHFIAGYQGIPEAYSRLNFSDLSEEEKVTYLHNSSVLSWTKTYRYTSAATRNYIESIPLSSERLFYQPFLDLYDGNSQKRLKMTNSLSKLKDNIQAIQTTLFSNGAISELYNIKNYAIAQYYFYFFRHVFTLGFNDAYLFFKPYIEAILCANTDNIDRPNKIMGFISTNEKYRITAIDCDILTKFIAVKDLMGLLNSNNITRFYAVPEIVTHITSCFSNLIDSLISCESFGYEFSSISVLVNLAQLLGKIELSDSEKGVISCALQRIFANKRFNNIFWSIGCPDFKYCTKAFSPLIKQLSNHTDISCIESIVGSPGFFDFIHNTNFYAAKRIIRFFLCKEDFPSFSEKLYALIDSEQIFSRKILLLRLFFKLFPENEKTIEYKAFLSDNYKKLDNAAVYDFVYADWLIPTEKDVADFLTEILSLYHKKNPAIQMFPDPLEQKMDRMYLLFITGKIHDITVLDEMCDDYPHLKFLLHPESFDYTQVDFSHYMWENFARNKQYMDYFIAHKDVLVGRIIERIQKSEATEGEKKILYGFLLTGDEIWRN